MKNNKIILEYINKYIVILQMNDDENKNALTPEFIENLQEKLNIIALNKDLKVVILRGNNDVFCSGANKSVLTEFLEGKIKPNDIFLPKMILDIPIPVIALMEGHAIGGGFAMGLCADIVLIAKNSRYGCNFMNMGFTPGMGTTKLLENVFPRVIAHELLYTGDLKKGKDFIGTGGFNAILQKENLFKKSLEIAEKIAEKPKKSLELLKTILSLPKRKCFEETLTSETMMHLISFANPEVKEMILENFNIS